MSSCGKAFVTLFHMFSSKPVDYLWAHVMPPLKPTLPSAHPSQGDSLKQKLRSWDSFLQLINWAHEEEKCQSLMGRAVLLVTIAVSLLLLSSDSPLNNQIKIKIIPWEQSCQPHPPRSWEWLCTGMVKGSAQNFFSSSIQTDPEPAPKEAECKIIFCSIPLLLERLEALHT